MDTKEVIKTQEEITRIASEYGKPLECANLATEITILGNKLIKQGRKEVMDWIPELIKEIKSKMWIDDWGVRGVIYPDILDELVKKETKKKLKEWGIKWTEKR